LTSARRHAHATATAAGDVAVYLPDTGEVLHAFSPGALVGLAAEERLDVSVREPELIRRCVEQAVAHGHRPSVFISRGDQLAPDIGGLVMGPASIMSSRMMLSASSQRLVAAELGIKAPPAPGRDLESAELVAAFNGDCERHWRELVIEAAGVKPRLSLGATACGIVPRKWRRAAAVLCQGEPWAWVRDSYHGGRIQCYQPGWSGEATEWDLRGAYAWALMQPIPDWKLYDRACGHPLPNQPAWFDCTVEVSGFPGPLPVREETGGLTWPESGRWRGTWTRPEVEQDGVRIVTVHKVLCGRWSRDLIPGVEHWAARREESTRPTERALLRSLSCALAGKLCQKPLRWVLWDDKGGAPPDGAIPLGFDSPLMAIPTIPSRWPFTCPQAGSYVTAMVRCKVRPELQRSDIIYTDTDSAHLPAAAAPPADVGGQPGQWSAKVSGPAHYKGVRQYRIGAKKVGALS
jgi:hypothetical protein